MSTAIVVAVVAGMLLLLGIGMVVNQLLRLKRYLNESPPQQPHEERGEPPGSGTF